MNRDIGIISITSGVFFLLIMIYLFGSPIKTSVFINVLQQSSFATARTTRFLRTEPENMTDEPYVFSKSEYFNQSRQPTENVIVFLVASFTGDARLAFDPYPRLSMKIRQLDERLGDNRVTDLIIFHTGYPFRKDIISIIEATPRNIYFVNVDHVFYKFSPGFLPHSIDPWWTQKGKWNYQHMCYFWFRTIFRLKIMQRYRYMMRLDDDSQLLGRWKDVFKIMVQHQAIYMANRRELDYEYILPGLTRIRNLTVAYIAKYNITPRNPTRYADFFNHTTNVPNYWNNVEVVDLSFMSRPDVAQYIEEVNRSNGIFLYRWGDAPLRYIMLALFANASEVLHREHFGLKYCHPC